MLTRLKWEVTIKCFCRFEIFKACTVRTSVFCDIGLCRLLEKYRILGVKQVAAKHRITYLKMSSCLSHIFLLACWASRLIHPTLIEIVWFLVFLHVQKSTYGTVGGIRCLEVGSLKGLVINVVSLPM